MSVLLVSHERYVEHEPGAGHPERGARLAAVTAAAATPDLAEAVVADAARPATRDELLLVHEPAVVDLVEELCSAGGGRIDGDTSVSAGSFEAARLAAGAGLVAIERLASGARDLDAAFCAIRPPGHHATPHRSMGFCLFNSVAVAAATLTAAGDRVTIVDIDAHHGNGTQDVFYADPMVQYVSLHQYPWYPGTGAIDERGVGAGRGTTLNLPMPAGTTGDVYRDALDRVILPEIVAFGPSWLLISAGFDAHRADPLTDLGLTAGDYADIVRELMAVVPAGRRIAFLEGGYDLDALRASAAATLATLAGSDVRPEAPSSGGPGAEVVDAVVEQLEAGEEDG